MIYVDLIYRVMKYIVISGGVLSGLGKGVVTSSLGALLRACNLSVTAIKIDPYLNYDAGTLSPYEHGEVYVLDDGCEVDLDLGNYERFMDAALCGDNSITTGKINHLVHTRERRGDYLGKTVQYIPHVTDTIQELIESAARGKGPKEPDVCLIELGGTVGDIESMTYIEALRQLRQRVKRENFCCCHVVFVPQIGPSHELKTKPTQESVAKLRQLGLPPDMIICRGKAPMTDAIKDKLSSPCEVDQKRIFSLPDLGTIYMVPIELQKQKIIQSISECLHINTCVCDRLKMWADISDIAMNAKEEINIALVGKYTALGDCYASVVKSLQHASYHLKARPNVSYIDSASLVDSESESWITLKAADCLIVPGGFGIRGAEGKIKAIKWARENKMPFLGICLGFQMAVIEYARNVLSIKNAHSAEFESDLQTYTPLVIEMLEYLDPDRNLGGTMRLGLRKTKFVVEKSILKQLYGNPDSIQERHRHRYEINPEYRDVLENGGLRFVGKNEDELRMEILELDPSKHPYFVAVQYHPEYLSRPFRPSPPYLGLMQAARTYQNVNDLS